MLKKPKYRKFDYQPRYYNPETDVTEKRKKKLGFRTARKSAQAKVKNPLITILLIIIIILLIVKLSAN